jgi:hypothetical protein
VLQVATQDTPCPATRDGPPRAADQGAGGDPLDGVARAG